MYPNSYSNYKGGGRIPSNLSGLGSGSSYSSSRYSGIRSSSSVPYGSSSPSYSSPLSSSTLSALALSMTTPSSRYVPSTSSKSAYSPASSASSSPRLSSSFFSNPSGSSSTAGASGGSSSAHFPTRSRSFNRGSDVGYGSWSVSVPCQRSRRVCGWWKCFFKKRKKETRIVAGSQVCVIHFDWRWRNAAFDEEEECSIENLISGQNMIFFLFYI